MENLRYWNIDEWKADLRAGGTMILSGWLLAEPGTWQWELDCAESDPVPVQCVRFARPDVEALYPDHPGTRKCGFRAAVSGVDRLQGQSETFVLRVRITSKKTAEQETELVIWKASASELSEKLKEISLSCHLDAVELSYQTMLTIRGWACDRTGSHVEKAAVSVRTAGGEELPVRQTVSRRPDVRLSLQEEWDTLSGQFDWEKTEVFPEELEIGFALTLNVEKLRDRTLILQIRGSGTSREFPVDLVRLRKEGSVFWRKAELLSWKNRKTNWEELKKRGPAGFLQYMDEQAGIVRQDYEAWAAAAAPTATQRRRQKKERFSVCPLYSIVIPLYNTPLPYLEELVDSVRGQTFPNWELCLADAGSQEDQGRLIRRKAARDSRIRYQKLEGNLGISENTNAAIRMASGDYIVFADHDDLLAPDALYELTAAVNAWAVQNTAGQEPTARGSVNAIGQEPAARGFVNGTGQQTAVRGPVNGPDVLYTDEDKVSMDGRHLFSPHFKSDYNLFRLRENNYICHLFAVRRSLLEQTGLLRREFDGAQDYDLILRCCEKANAVVHVPKALYHWRSHMDSTAADPSTKTYAYEAGKRALEEHYQRLGLPAEVELREEPGWYRSHVKIQGEPLISILIPTRDHLYDLRVCVEAILEMSTWKRFEILILDNGSRQPETIDWLRRAEQEHDCVRVLTWDHPFNFSAINNYGAREAAGGYLLFLNNDTRVITPDWLQEMLMVCQQPDVGAVGAKLFYPDGTIQHAGVVLGLGGIAGHLYCQGDGEDPGYMGRLISVSEVSAVTAACMMVKRSAFEEVRGFDETLCVAFNDIDLCMKLRENGQKIVFTPHAQLVHYESKSRGAEDTPEKQLRFAAETERFREKWGSQLLTGDPYYSPNLSVTEGDCRLR